MKNAAKKICLICLATMFLFGIVFALSSCESKGKKIDHEIWDVTVLKDRNGEKYARIWGLNEKGIKQSKENTEAIIPETIGGYPVKVLDAFQKTWPSDATDKPAELGELTKIKIEASVTIDHCFFEKSLISTIEFTNKNSSILKNASASHYGLILFMIPEDSDMDYLGNYVGFKHSEIVDGYLIKNQTFHGYIGTESNIEIQEGITDLSVYWSYLLHTVEFVKFPKTLQLIRKDNIFNGYPSLKKVFVSTNTVIEDGAFKAGVDIIYY